MASGYTGVDRPEDLFDQPLKPTLMADDSSLFDKVVEMGMGMAMVSQMPRMMNAAMPDATGMPTPPPMNGPEAGLQIYASINNNQAGPFSEQEFITLIQKDMVNANSLVWKKGMRSWMPASQVPETGKLLLLYSNNK